MPQMAPILWDATSSLSLIMLLILITKIYFYLKESSMNSELKKHSIEYKKMTWKW